MAFRTCQFLNKRLFESHLRMNPTQIKLIEAAEMEFAERGFHGTSVRDITARAGVNVAAVNYHFESKEGLFVAMIRHRTEPIDTLRMKMFKDELKASNGEPIPLDKLVEIMVRPLVDAYHGGAGSKAFIRAMERGMADEENLCEPLFRSVIGEFIATFRHELGRTLNHVPGDIVDHCFAHILTCVGGTFRQRSFPNNRNSSLTFPDADLLCAFVRGGVESLISSKQG